MEIRKSRQGQFRVAEICFGGIGVISELLVRLERFRRNREVVVKDREVVVKELRRLENACQGKAHVVRSKCGNKVFCDRRICQLLSGDLMVFEEKER
jgi:hypothetical protein